MAEETPLHDVEKKAGAVFAEEAGWLLPQHYGDPRAEYQAALEGAALFDVSHRGKIEVRGPDATTFLHNLCTNDIKNIPICEAFFCNVQARVVGHAWICAGGSSYWLDVAPGNDENLTKHLNHYLISEQVEIFDRTRNFIQLHVAGPQVGAIIKRVDDEAPTLLHRATEETGRLLRKIWRHPLLGVLGYDVLCRPADAAKFWEWSVSAGARPAGLEAYHILRVEAGTPIYGVDFDESNLAPEVGRTKQAISYTKGCYLGQEPIIRIRDLGHVNRTLVGLKISAPSSVPRGAKLFRDGKEVGHVTSCVLSPRLGTIALGYARRGSEAAGTIVEVESGMERHRAEVVSLPFVGPGGGAG